MLPTLRLVLALALTTAAFAVPATVGTPSPAAAAAPKKVKTDYGMRATGFGAKINGGIVPVSSNHVGWSSLACTSKAGIKRANGVASAKVPGLGTIRGIRTRVWTTKSGPAVSSWSEHKIADISLLRSDNSPEPAFELAITGIRALSRAWHDRRGFHASNKVDVLGIKVTLAGKTRTFDLPAPGKPLKVGPITIELGGKSTKAGGSGARAMARGLAIIIDNGRQPDTRVIVARTLAQIEKGVKTGVFHGNAAGVHGSVLDPTLKLGRTPQQLMPCTGTGGNVRRASAATVNVDGLARVGALETRIMGKQNRRRAKGYTVAEVAGVNLLDGRIKISGVKAKAKVVRKANGKVKRSARGTRVARIVIDGRPLDIDLSKKIDIAGLVSIEPKVVQWSKSGLRVIGLRIKLLQGSGAVINLAEANLKIRKF